MTKNLLLITKDVPFSNAMKDGLEQAGYHLYSASRKGDAVILTEEENCSIVFLDLEMGEHVALDTGIAIRTVNPDLSLILFSDADIPPVLDELRPWVLLRKPTYITELLNMLNDNSFQQDKPVRATNESPAVHLNNDDNLAWLADANKAAQHLTRLTLESSAQAALITRENDLWAYAGQLSQEAAQELGITITRHWDGQKGSDLLRFVRLEATKAEHMLYATRLADNVVLALVFDAETPFSTIRSQAGQLVNRLSSPGSIKTPDQAVKELSTPASHEAPTQYDEDEDSDLEIPNIADILSNVPSPKPAGFESEDPDLTHKSRPRQDRFSRESSPAMHMGTDNEQTIEHAVEDLDATMPSKSKQRPKTPVRRPAPGELDETRPHSITEVAGRVILDPVTPGLYNLTYACLLVPRFTSHYLTGDISDMLSEWLPQTCVAFGWRLEYLAVRPEYVQWVVNVPPATSPGYLMRIMRQQTSEKIFTEFPRLKKENPSGDFWAPGYLIMGGTQPHPPQLVKDYIKQTRTRQGLEH